MEFLNALYLLHGIKLDGTFSFKVSFNHISFFSVFDKVHKTHLSVAENNLLRNFTRHPLLL